MLLSLGILCISLYAVLVGTNTVTGWLNPLIISLVTLAVLVPPAAMLNQKVWSASFLAASQKKNSFLAFPKQCHPPVTVQNNSAFVFPTGTQHRGTVRTAKLGGYVRQHGSEGTLGHLRLKCHSGEVLACFCGESVSTSRC